MTNEEIQKHIEQNCRHEDGRPAMDEQAFYEGAKWMRDQALRTPDATGRSEQLPPCKKCGKKWNGSLETNCSLKDGQFITKLHRLYAVIDYNVKNKHSKKYIDAMWVLENPNRYDERDVIDAKRYCNSYLDGYNQALRMHDSARQKT